jgi:predicted DNA-binding protein with PD1-like motif
LLKFDDGEDLLKEIRTLATRENVRVGTILLLGGIRTVGISARKVMNEKAGLAML